MKFTATIFLALCCLLCSRASAQKSLQPYCSEVAFKIKNAGFTVTGRFAGLKTDLFFSPEHLASSALAGSVEVNTLTTGIHKRDEHLKSAAYFDAAKYPTIAISSVKLYQKEKRYAGLFKVTIKGITKEQEITFDFTEAGNDAMLKGELHINRLDYGVGTKSMMMADDVVINIVLRCHSVQIKAR